LCLLGWNFTGCCAYYKVLGAIILSQSLEVGN
jgi:hypothetical protein